MPVPKNKTEKMATILKIWETEDYVSIKDIATRTNLRPATAHRYLQELLAHRNEAVKTKDVDILIRSSAASYQLIAEQAVDIALRADSDEDRLKAIELQRKAQESMDKLFRACGIFVQKDEHKVSIEQIRDSDEYKQVAASWEMFLNSKGIAFEEYLEFTKKIESGKLLEINGKFVGEPDRNKLKPDTVYKIGYDNRNTEDPRDFGAGDVHVLKAKLTAGNLTPEDEDRALDDMTEDDKMEYIQFKSRLNQEKEEEEVENRHKEG